LLSKERLLKRVSILATLHNYYSTKSRIEQLREKLIQNKISESNVTDQWQERLRNLDLKIKEEQHKLNNLQSKLKLSQNVYSPVNGIVSTIQKTRGDLVNAGDTVISIASVGKGMDAIVYISPEDGKRVRPNMRALVSPATVEKEEFGSIKGKVRTVSQFPANQQSMMAILHNEDLVRQFAKETAPITLRIHLENDPKTPSGFAWTSSKGPSQKITPGTLVSARITIRKKAPVALIIPALRKMLNID